MGKRLIRMPDLAFTLLTLVLGYVIRWGGWPNLP